MVWPGHELELTQLPLLTGATLRRRVGRNGVMEEPVCYTPRAEGPGANQHSTLTHRGARAPPPAHTTLRPLSLWDWAGTSTGAGPYLVEREGAHSVRGQLHCVQQSGLNEAVGLSATDWPVLIALHLQKDRQDSVQRCLETSKSSAGKRAGVPGQKQGGRASLPSYENLQTQILRSTVPPLTKPHQALMLRCHSCPSRGNEGYN